MTNAFCTINTCEVLKANKCRTSYIDLCEFRGFCWFVCLFFNNLYISKKGRESWNENLRSESFRFLLCKGEDMLKQWFTKLKMYASFSKVSMYQQTLSYNFVRSQFFLKVKNPK